MGEAALPCRYAKINPLFIHLEANLASAQRKTLCVQ